MSEKCKYSGHDFVPRPGGEPGEQICQRCDYYPTPSMPAMPAGNFHKLSEKKIINLDHIREIELLTNYIYGRDAGHKVPVIYLTTLDGSYHQITNRAEMESLADRFWITLPDAEDLGVQHLAELDGDDDQWKLRELLIRQGKLDDPERDVLCLNCDHTKWMHVNGECTGLVSESRVGTGEACLCRDYRPRQATSEVVF